MKKNKFIYDRVLTYLQKNRDYGNSVDKTRLLIGADADLVRMADKIHRIENLMMTNDAKVAESIEDTIFDLINYMAIYQSGEGHDCIETLSSPSMYVKTQFTGADDSVTVLALAVQALHVENTPKNFKRMSPQLHRSCNS